LGPCRSVGVLDRARGPSWNLGVASVGPSDASALLIGPPVGPSL
jgi:hypothetical protein